jgi:hypothetical protein
MSALGGERLPAPSIATTVYTWAPLPGESV